MLACLAEKLSGWTKQYEAAFKNGEPAPLPAEYAALWLEKLVQVEVTVPKLSADEKKAILTGHREKEASAPDTSPPPRAWMRWLGWTRRIPAILPAIGALAIIGFAGRCGVQMGGKAPKATKAPQEWYVSAESSADRLRFTLKATDEKPKVVPVVVTPPTAPQAPGSSTQKTGSEIDLGPVPDAQPGEPVSAAISPPQRSYVHLWFSAAGLVVAMASAIYALRKLRRWRRGETGDSAEFEASVEKWFSEIERKKETPRAIKRFVNRLRLYASLARNADDADGQPLISERAIVGFGVMEETCPDVLRSGLKTGDVGNLFAARGMSENSGLGVMKEEADVVLLELRSSNAADAVRRLTPSCGPDSKLELPPRSEANGTRLITTSNVGMEAELDVIRRSRQPTIARSAPSVT